MQLEYYTLTIVLAKSNIYIFKYNIIHRSPEIIVVYKVVYLCTRIESSVLLYVLESRVIMYILLHV